jgi:hypothetical protein
MLKNWPFISEQAMYYHELTWFMFIMTLPKGQVQKLYIISEFPGGWYMK